MLKESPKLFVSQEGGINMCTAINEMVRDGELRGERRGEKRGEKRGEIRGEVRGENKYNELLKLLLKGNYIEEIRRVTIDKDYRNQLYLKYNL